MKQKLTTEVDKSTIITGDFSSAHSATDEAGRHKNSENI